MIPFHFHRDSVIIMTKSSGRKELGGFVSAIQLIWETAMECLIQAKGSIADPESEVGGLTAGGGKRFVDGRARAHAVVSGPVFLKVLPNLASVVSACIRLLLSFALLRLDICTYLHQMDLCFVPV